MASDRNEFLFPPIPYEAWKESKTTLHLFAQIVGKIRMALTPKRNHWWHVTLYLSARGLTTGPMPYSKGVAQFDFNFIDHVLRIDTSAGERHAIELGDLTVAGFYNAVMQALDSYGIQVQIHGKPYDLPIDMPFQKDTAARAWDAEAITRYWRALTSINSIFQEFSGWFYGKATPAHLYWHSFDLAYTRFSGREAPPMGETTQANREAYSHEVISFGFWAGDENVPFPSFYSYTWPEPDALKNQVLTPETASWVENNGSHMAIYKYDDLRAAPDPRSTLLSFLQSAYLAGAELAEWDIEPLKTPWA